MLNILNAFKYYYIIMSTYNNLGYLIYNSLIVINSNYLYKYYLSIKNKTTKC